MYFNGDFGEECEPFYFPISIDDKGPELRSPNGRLIFECAKTRMERYDEVLTACLIAAKRHFENEITVHSDGDLRDWQRGIMLARKVLGNIDYELKQIEEDFENES